MNTTHKLSRRIIATTIIGGLLVSSVLPSCGLSNKAKGGIIGGTTGGVIGGIIGHQSDNTAVGVLIGTAVGGTAGVLIGRHMDKQAEELQSDLEGATVQRVGEGILITFTDGMNFDVDSYNVPSNGTSNLNDLAEILKKYEDTEILIEGHTDDTGAEDYNQELSEKRANSVKRYLISRGIPASRLSSIGYGEGQPISDNSSANGRKENRRVEVAIYANDRMEKAAKKGDLGSID